MNRPRAVDNARALSAAALPLGWVEHWDPKKNVPYYVNLNASPPTVTFTCPAIQPHAPIVNPPRQPNMLRAHREPPIQIRNGVSAPPSDPTSSRISTTLVKPSSSDIRQNASPPMASSSSPAITNLPVPLQQTRPNQTYAQQLYASSLSPRLQGQAESSTRGGVNPNTTANLAATHASHSGLGSSYYSSTINPAAVAPSRDRNCAFRLGNQPTQRIQFNAQVEGQRGNVFEPYASPSTLRTSTPSPNPLVNRRKRPLPQPPQPRSSQDQATNNALKLDGSAKLPVVSSQRSEEFTLDSSPPMPSAPRPQLKNLEEPQPPRITNAQTDVSSVQDYLEMPWQLVAPVPTSSSVSSRVNGRDPSTLSAESSSSSESPESSLASPYSSMQSTSQTTPDRNASPVSQIQSGRSRGSSTVSSERKSLGAPFAPPQLYSLAQVLSTTSLRSPQTSDEFDPTALYDSYANSFVSPPITAGAAGAASPLSPDSVYSNDPDSEPAAANSPPSYASSISQESYHAHPLVRTGGLMVVNPDETLPSSRRREWPTDEKGRRAGRNGTSGRQAGLTLALGETAGEDHSPAENDGPPTAAIIAGYASRPTPISQPQTHAWGALARTLVPPTPVATSHPSWHDSSIPPMPAWNQTTPQSPQVPPAQVGGTSQLQRGPTLSPPPVYHVNSLTTFRRSPPVIGLKSSHQNNGESVAVTPRPVDIEPRSRSKLLLSNSSGHLARAKQIVLEL